MSVAESTFSRHSICVERRMALGSAFKQEHRVQDRTKNGTDVTSLERFPTGSSGFVRELHCGQRLAARLAALGLTLGAKIEVLQNAGRGPLLVRVRGTRLAVGRGQASKILIGHAR